jgi:4a-hydroxytetrahydrobiopterin dehydratase
MKTLPKDEVTSYIQQKLNSWAFRDSAIFREYKFKTFSDAISFMVAVAFEVEKLDHHPDWCNSYNKVNVTLSTHSAKGVTQLDMDLATAFDKTYHKFESTLK